MRVDSHQVKPGRTKQKERTRRAILTAAVERMRTGVVPTVEEAAADAGVSPATGYRYFPSQGSLVEHALRMTFPQWDDEPLTTSSVDERVDTVIGRGVPDLSTYEAIHRAHLRFALDQWIAARAGSELKEPPAFRSGRMRAVQEIITPIANDLDSRTKRRLERSLAVVIGIESLVVLRDLFDAGDGEVSDVLRWMAKALTRAAIEGSTKTARTKRRR
jgi:AcrR family transcriptional regulator